MKYFGDGLSEKHKELGRIIRKRDMFADSKKLFLELHGALHLSEISHGKTNEVDLLFDDLLPHEYAVIPKNKDKTIAYIVWHIARIEDLTLNILVADSKQVFNSEWQKKISAVYVDTGNAMTDSEIMNLSKEIRIEDLLSYRSAVGVRTRAIINNLSEDDMKRKVSETCLDKIRANGGVAKGAEWLLNYWGRKDVAGILLMPPTRHLILHLNDCCKLKAEIRTRKHFYMS
jgi:hypothetical protein